MPKRYWMMRPLVLQAYELNDRCPLGSAAGYGVPLPIDRQKVSDLLGFTQPCHNVLYASQTRGKVESIVVDALTQVMLSLSRFAEDLIVYSMPEFGYFSLPSSFCTGSSIMPQKNNPDVLELVRAKSSRIAGSQRNTSQSDQEPAIGLPERFTRGEGANHGRYPDSQVMPENT